MTPNTISNVPPHHWMTETLTLARERSRLISVEELAEVCGASVHWVKAFIAGKIEDPSVNKVGRLHDFLESKR